MGAMPLALGVCALLLIAYGCFRVITAQTTDVSRRGALAGRRASSQCGRQRADGHVSLPTRSAATHAGRSAQTASAGFGVDGCASEP